MKTKRMIPQIALSVSLATVATIPVVAQQQQTLPNDQINKILNDTINSAPNQAGPSIPTVPPQMKPAIKPNDQSTIDQIMNDTLNSNPNREGTNLQVPALPTDVRNLPAPAIPGAADHNKNKVIDLGPIHTGPLLRIAAMGPIQLEASYTEPITLASVLDYTLQNSLPIRINYLTRESNKYGFYGSLGSFLPSVQLNNSYTHSHIYPHTNTRSRVFSESVSMPVFQGGRVMYGMLAQLYRYQASNQQFRASINDTLLNAYNAYYNLVLQRALLQIRIKSVEVSETQLRLNQQLYMAGTGTRFAVMQSQSQLALDRQALLNQQVQLRLAAMNLAFIANMPMAANVVPLESTVAESALIDETLTIDDLLSLTLTRRPELKQYQNLWLASARSIQIAASPLYPTASFTETFTHSSTSITPGRSSSSSSSTASSSGSSGNVVGAGAFGGKFDTLAFNFNMNWQLANLGVTSVTNILTARAISQQTMLQANQVLQQVSQQVRSAYLNALTAREQIDVAATGVESSAEELRLANLRVQTGVGTNLELIQAQRDYIQALINQAQAIITSNQAQAQLLHDTGLISTDTLLKGYSPRRISSTGNQLH